MQEDTSFKYNVLEFMTMYNKISQFSFTPNSQFWTNIGTIKLPHNNTVQPLKIEVLYGTLFNKEAITNNISINFYALQNSNIFNRYSTEDFAICNAYNIIKQGHNHTNIACVQVDVTSYQFWIKFSIGGGTCSVFIYDDYKFTIDGNNYFRLPEDYPTLNVEIKSLALQDRVDNLINHCIFDASNNCYVQLNNDVNDSILRDQLHKIHDHIETLESNYRIIKCEINNKANKADVFNKVEKEFLNNQLGIIDDTFTKVHHKFCEKANVEELAFKADLCLLDNKVNKIDLDKIIHYLNEKIDCKLSIENSNQFVKYNSITKLLKCSEAENIYFKKCDIDKKILDCIISRSFLNPSELCDILNNLIMNDYIKKDEISDILNCQLHNTCKDYMDCILNDKLIISVSGDCGNSIIILFRNKLLEIRTRLVNQLSSIDDSLPNCQHKIDEINALLTIVNKNINDISSNTINSTQLSEIYHFICLNYYNVHYHNAVYYTAHVIDEKFNTLSTYINTLIQNINTTTSGSVDLSNYYNKTYVDNTLITLSSNVNQLINTLSSNVNQSINTLSNSIPLNYYNKTYVDNTLSSIINQSINTLSSNVNQAINTLSNSIPLNYYNKTYVDTKTDQTNLRLNTLSDSITTLSSNLSRLDSSYNSLSAAITTATLGTSDSITQTLISNYYTNDQIDTSLNALNASLSGLIATKAPISNPIFTGTASLPNNTLYKNIPLLSYGTIQIYYINVNLVNVVNLEKCIVDSTINSIQSTWIYDSTVITKSGLFGIDITVNSNFVMPKLIYAQSVYYELNVLYTSFVSISKLLRFYPSNPSNILNISAQGGQNTLTNILGAAGQPIAGSQLVSTLYLIY